MIIAMFALTLLAFHLLLILLFLAAIPIFITGIIFLLIALIRKQKTKYYKLFSVIGITGIILGLSFPLPLMYRVFFYTEEKIVDTATHIYWENDDNGIDFTYNDRNYTRLVFDKRGDSRYFEGDEVIANIDKEYSSFKELFITRTLDFSGKFRRNIYTIKNCNDFSLLTDDDSPSNQSHLYCDVDLLQEKKEYYENSDNYDYFISRREKYSLSRKYEKTSCKISESDFAALEEINKIKRSGDKILIPRV